jgi:dolichyl-phosphate beta-glucosyltransferase
MLQFSLVIPAHNEVNRLPPYLVRVRDYLENTFPGNYEVIVVDDGSSDDTYGRIKSIALDWPQLRVVKNPVNRGKGFAVRTGVLAAEGELVLFTDADGATPIEDEFALRERVSRGAQLAIGSRHIGTAGAGVQRRFVRGSLSVLFSKLVQLICHSPFKDTQCGFKMFTKESAHRIFAGLSEDGYLFDIVVLAMADRLGYETVEVPVRWSEIHGSKVRLVRDCSRMLFGLPRVARLIRGFASETR